MSIKNSLELLGDIAVRWKGREESTNVEDRRRSSTPQMAAGGGGLLILIAIVAIFLGADPRVVIQNLMQGQQQAAGLQPADEANTAPLNPREEEMAQFVRVVLKDTEDVWDKLFAQAGQRYQKPKLVLFTGSVKSACGFANAAVGPFYCPGDKKVYIDLSFFDELAEKYRAAGEFPRAYVIAHEVGHHIQNLMGTSDQVHTLQQRVGKKEGNQLSVRLELQADYYAGVWAHHVQKMKNVLEEQDIKQAIVAAQAIGDDRLQKQAQGYVVPDSFTHGSAEQRARWFYKGFKSGDINGGNTFDGEYETL